MQGRIWLFSAVLACLVAAQAVAQDNGDYLPKAGDFRIGFSTQGGSGVTYTDIEDVKTTDISFGGSYFFSSNFSFDIGLSYGESKSDGNTAKATVWGVGASLYFGGGGTNNFVPFISAQYLSFDLDVAGNNFNPTGFGVGIGGHLFLSQNTSLDIAISYANVRGGGNEADGFGFGIGFSIWFR